MDTCGIPGGLGCLRQLAVWQLPGQSKRRAIARHGAGAEGKQPLAASPRLPSPPQRWFWRAGCEKTAVKGCLENPMCAP